MRYIDVPMKDAKGVSVAQLPGCYWSVIIPAMCRIKHTTQ